MHSVSNTVPGAVALLMREAPLSPGKVQCAWSVAVGPAMQRATTVVRLDGGRLFVKAVDPQWAREVRRSSRVILPRLQYLLGTGVVSQLEVGTAR
jgi:hypothetical protein